jgi:CDP-diacylglycerol--glycerol-3-phosphate 3-phosphatidyltransferase
MKLQNLPNFLTLVRIALIPVVLVLYFYQPNYQPYPHFSWFNFALVATLAIASTTDLIDGYLARKWNVSSKLGAFLDPVADKLMVVVALVLLVDFYHDWFITLCAIIIIMREVLVSALREWMGDIGKRNEIKVSDFGKIKTFTQVFAILFLFYQADFFGINSYITGLILLSIATILTLISGYQYLTSTLKYIINAENL